MTLKAVSDMKVGELGLLNSIEGDEMSVLLGSMGVLPGSIIEMVRIAPFGGGCYIKSDGQNMVLRISEAKAIMIKIDEPVVHG